MSILKPWLFLEEEEPGSGILGRVTLSEPRTQNRFPFSSIHRKTMYSTLCMCVCYVIVILLQFLSDKNYPKILHWVLYKKKHGQTWTNLRLSVS